MNDKTSLRRMMRDRRRELSTVERARASEKLCRRIARHPVFIGAGRVGISFPTDGEIDPTALANPGPSRRFYLPILPPPGERRLWFAPWKPGDRLIADRYGILEPATQTRVRAQSLDLLLTPLVAFDRAGGRIGMGGGYYDASLNFMIGKSRIHPLRTYGVAFGFQQIDMIPREDWDVPLHGVFTDSTFISSV